MPVPCWVVKLPFAVIVVELAALPSIFTPVRLSAALPLLIATAVVPICIV